MHRSGNVAIALVLMAAAGVAAGAAPPAEVFGALPANTDVTMTPDGKRLAWIDNAQDKPRVEMFDIDARKTLRVLALPPRMKLRYITWNDNETLIITFSQTGVSATAAAKSREFFVNIAYDASGGEGRFLPAPDGKAGSAAEAIHAGLIRTRINKPHTVIMAVYGLFGYHGYLAEVDTNTGVATPIRYGNEHTVQWVVDRNGKAVAREDWDPLKRAYRLYALFGENIKEILRKDDNERPMVGGVLADDSALVLFQQNDRPHLTAWALPLDGSPARVLAEEPDADVEGVLLDQDVAVAGVYVGGATTKMHWIDPKAQERQEVLQHAFPNRQVWLRAWTKDGTRALAMVESASSAPVYYFVDFTTHRADIAAEEYPALADVKLGELREITYKARDGTSIPAYLTLPPGAPAGTALPLVVLPHGGPNARDYPSFDWMVQFLATRGYAVLQPQFRGSTGFGEAFEKAGYRQWGGLMQDDVSDGVQAMIQQGIADPHHIGIVGMSYGGYAALAGAAFTPTLYDCAVSVNGVSDLRALMHESVPMYGTFIRFISAGQSNFKERVGGESDPALYKKSPINSVSTIAVPVMLAYGSGDGVVANEQTLRMADAMNKAGKAVMLVKLPAEDHWLSGAETRTQLLKELETFLHQHL